MLFSTPTWQRFVRFLEPKSSSIPATSFINSEIAPLPQSLRTWGPASFAGFWTVASVNISNWTTGSALISLGLNVGQASAAIVLGNCIVSVVVFLTGTPGAHWGIPFAVINRSSWGMYGFFFVLANRAILSFTWHATQSYFGARCVRVLIASMAPNFYNLDASLAGGTLDSSTLISFVIFCILQLPLLYLKPHLYRVPFFVFSASITLCSTVIFIWAMARSGGAGVLLDDASAVSGVTAVHGSELGWNFVYAVTTILGSICAGMLNQSDMTRFARKPSDPVWAQLITIPVTRIVCGIFGIVTTSCAAQWWPEKGLLWMPQDILTQVQLTSGDGARAAVFFAALFFTLSQLGMNTADNAMPSGIDLTCMFPRFMTIRRGAYVTAAVSVLIQPWQLLNGSSIYLTVMGSYAVFIAPLTGIMCGDYFLVRQRRFKLSALYDASPASIYWYTKGLNLRAGVAWVIGVVPSLPGFVHYVQKKGVLEGGNAGANHLYQLCWPLGFSVSLVVFVALSRLFPPPGVGEVDDQDYFNRFGQAQVDVEKSVTPDEKVEETKDDNAMTTVPELYATP